MKKFTVTFQKEFDAYDLEDCENRLLEFFQLAKSDYVVSEIVPEFKYEEKKKSKSKRTFLPPKSAFGRFHNPSD
jgi:hypothetical protein